MLKKIIITNKCDEKKLEKLCDKLRNMKSMPDGIYDLTYEIQNEHEAASYCNDRIMWLGWQLEKNGFNVEWSKC